MKTYQTWEAFKMLSENPNLKFEKIYKNQEFRRVLRVSSSGYFHIDFYRNGEVSNDSTPIANFSGNIYTEAKWTLVQEPVSFMEAINSGKKIYSEYYRDNVFDLQEDCGDITSFLYKICPYRNVKEVINGKWYIQEN